ncbi:LOW QUALITY PROTEIN: hypothetical protein ACHAWO_004190 [Cyclotella atomus]|uniref:Uncharacterized protein n=1 Tax=Cyclotella atomus TaxID=382360 RepID=A0ABD3NZT8_9STRA
MTVRCSQLCIAYKILLVRQKNRWLLVQFDYEPNTTRHCTPNETSSPINKRRKLSKSDSQNSSSSSALDEVRIHQITSTDIFRSVQETLTHNYGIDGSSATELLVMRIYDPKVNIAVIKTSREKNPIVRSSLVFLTKIKTIKAVATTICVSGSARTAKNAAWKEVQKLFFSKETVIEYGNTVSVRKARAAAKKALTDWKLE